MKKVLLFVVLIAAVIGASLNLSYGRLAEGDECCKNGYNRWRTAWKIESIEFFKDCWCNDKTGKTMAACNC